MLNQINGFDGRFPFFTRIEGHDGRLGVMQIGDHSDALVGSEFEFVVKKRGQAAKAFSSGRRCVRALQKQLNLSEFELAPGDFGPIWPSDLVGSISHSRELVAASILRNALGVGIDIEY